MVNAIRYESIHQWTMFASYYGRCGRMKKQNDHAEPTKVGTLKNNKTPQKTSYFLGIMWLQKKNMTQDMLCEVFKESL